MKKTAFFTALFAFVMIVASAPVAEAAYTRPASSRATTCRTSNYGLGFGYSATGKTLCEPETCTPGNSDYGLGFGYSISGKRFCGDTVSPTYSLSQKNSVTTYRLTSNTSFYGSNTNTKSSYDARGAYSSNDNYSDSQYSDKDYEDENYNDSDNDNDDQDDNGGDDSQYDDRDNNGNSNNNNDNDDEDDSNTGSGNGGGPFSW